MAIVGTAAVEVEGGMVLGFAGDVAGEGIGEEVEPVVGWKQVSLKRPDESERVMFRLVPMSYCWGLQLAFGICGPMQIQIRIQASIWER